MTVIASSPRMSSSPKRTPKVQPLPLHLLGRGRSADVVRHGGGVVGKKSRSNSAATSPLPSLRQLASPASSSSRRFSTDRTECSSGPPTPKHEQPLTPKSIMIDQMSRSKRSQSLDATPSLNPDSPRVVKTTRFLLPGEENEIVIIARNQNGEERVLLPPSPCKQSSTRSLDSGRDCYNIAITAANNNNNNNSTSSSNQIYNFANTNTANNSPSSLYIQSRSTSPLTNYNNKRKTVLPWLDLSIHRLEKKTSSLRRIQSLVNTINTS